MYQTITAFKAITANAMRNNKVKILGLAFGEYVAILSEHLEQ